jgi:hypothetical protein
VLVLRRDLIEVVAPGTGTVLAIFQATNILDLAATELPISSSFGGHARQMNAVAMGIRNSEHSKCIEGHPCALHYCLLTHRIYVGFSSGGVGIIDILGPRLDTASSRAGFLSKQEQKNQNLHSASRLSTTYSSLSANNVHVRDNYVLSTEVHSSKITKIVTYRLKDCYVIAVSDSLGMLSTWRLAPKTDGFVYVNFDIVCNV